jgi:hypothetical protein
MACCSGVGNGLGAGAHALLQQAGLALFINGGHAVQEPLQIAPRVRPLPVRRDHVVMRMPIVGDGNGCLGERGIEAPCAEHRRQLRSVQHGRRDVDVKLGLIGVGLPPAAAVLFQRLVHVVPAGVQAHLNLEQSLKLRLRLVELGQPAEFADDVDVVFVSIRQRRRHRAEAERALDVDLGSVLADRRLGTVQPFAERLVALLGLFVAVVGDLEGLGEILEHFFGFFRDGRTHMNVHFGLLWVSWRVRVDGRG